MLVVARLRAPPDQMTRLLALTLLASLSPWMLVRHGSSPATCTALAQHVSDS